MCLSSVKRHQIYNSKVSSFLFSLPPSVAASSVVYLHCSGSETIFKAHDMPNLLEMTKETEMAIPSTALSDLLMTLKEQARDDQGIFDVRQLVDLIDIEKGSLATKRHQGQKIDVTVKLAIDVLQSV